MTIRGYPLVRIACAILECTAAVLLLLVLATVFMQVVFRYVIGIAVPWTEEAARYLNIWAVFLGGAVAVAHDAHLKVTFLLNRLRGAARAAVEVILVVAVLGLDIVLLIGGVRLVGMNWQQMATTLPVPVGTLYLALVIYAAVALVFGAMIAWRNIATLARGDR